MTFDTTNTRPTARPAITTTQNWVPNANEISKETIINMLVTKGICTPEELFQMEGRLRDERSYSADGGLVVNVKNVKDRGRFYGLKRSMSKRRWTRRLGTMLFGWKWKKIKKEDYSIQ
ncbi:hypothetical protein JW960_00585 [candidate division KSB1 bacterium]|nr:hypothetical protein [candidate division KSB1 bacterium]